MKRVLVAGATGYLGGFVCQELKARGHFVRALARSPEKLDRLKDSLDEIVGAEITQPETLERVCDGIDVVFSSLGIHLGSAFESVRFGTKKTRRRGSDGQPLSVNNLLRDQS